MTLIVVYGLFQVIHRLLGDQVVVYLLAARSFGARQPLLAREGEHIIERGPTFGDLARRSNRGRLALHVSLGCACAGASWGYPARQMGLDLPALSQRHRDFPERLVVLTMRGERGKADAVAGFPSLRSSINDRLIRANIRGLRRRWTRLRWNIW